MKFIVICKKIVQKSRKNIPLTTQKRNSCIGFSTKKAEIGDLGCTALINGLFCIEKIGEQLLT